MPTPSLTIRNSAAVVLAAAIGFASLPGCGPAQPPGNKEDKKEDPKPSSTTPPSPPAPDSSSPISPLPKLPEGPPKTTLGVVEKAAEKAATDFLSSVVHGVATADSLSTTFVRIVGRPRFESEKAKGYSADEATSWLRGVGTGINFGPELKRPDQAGDVVYLRGLLQGKPGGYCLRMLKEGGAWKVDWFAVSSVEPGSISSPETPEGAAQAFAIAAFVESITDLNGMPRIERDNILSATMIPPLRSAWAEPFDSDRAKGLDYSPGRLFSKAVEIGGGTRSYTASRAPIEPIFKVVLTKPAGTLTYMVELVKGPAPHVWLVSKVTEAKS